MNHPIPKPDQYQDMREALRDLCKSFDSAYWQKVDHERDYPEAFVKAMTEAGWLAALIPEEYGGSGVDRLYSVIMMEEQARAGDSASGFSLHSDIVANYLNNFASEELKQKWLPKMASGEAVGSIAMTEPGTGSDLQAVRTSAIADGDDYIVNGSKIFITNGYLCDISVVVVKTGDPSKGAESISLLLIEADRPGFSKGRPLKKVGMKGQDTCELFFDNVRVPKSNLIGMEGMGFIMLMKELAWERLMIAIMCASGCEQVLAHTLAYVRDRKVFGKPVAAYQNTKYKLAELRSETQIARVFVDKCIEEQIKGTLQVDAAAAAKYWVSDLMSKVADECVQLHGGYGFMLEYPVAQAYIDTRANRIYGGTNEIMKELISRTF
mgnify:CR=1 FL=1